MNLILPLTAAEGAKLAAKAEAEGTTPESLVRQAIQPILDSQARHLAEVLRVPGQDCDIVSESDAGDFQIHRTDA